MFLFVVVLFCLLTVTGGMQCMGCEDVLNPNDCTNIISCSSNQMCITQEFTGMTNERRYRLGCYNQRGCSILMQHSTETNMCIHCCDSDNCNKLLCASDISTIITSPPITTIKPTQDTHPYVTTNQPQVTSKWGMPVVLSCAGHNLDYVKFVDQGGRTLMTNNEQSMDATIQIRPQSNMQITCMGVKGNHVVASTNIEVTVTGDKPYFPQGDHKLIVLREGQNYILNCTAQGFPEPAASWHFVRLPGHYQINGDTLQLIDMTSIMAGMYTCYAHNYFGTAPLIYEVQYIPSPTTVLMTTTASTVATTTNELLIRPTITLQTELIIPEGQATTVILCQAQGTPTPTVTWDTIDHHFPANVKPFGNYLIISNAGVYDSKFYLCLAQNKAGADVKIINVIINHIVKPTTDRPHTRPAITLQPLVQARYGSSVNLNCTATGYPEPTITWHANSRTYKTNMININEAKLEDDGFYTCIATNDAGHTQANTILTVTGDSPHISQRPSSAIKSSGETESFTCTATGLPLPIITWTYTSFVDHSSSLPPHSLSSDSTTITLTRIQDSGTLKCIATNPYGTANAQANVLMSDSNALSVGK